ncbi:unnamed protein product [Mytilus edulis]|uniref:G-protein coupled receptors family 1 profile domain-containing protein n=1 Tax=Mytilus edulis TaxID=6550 RepID=A0A8S3VPS4_MYTED|nr:unnamed protein product [Mytilus edulis]
MDHLENFRITENSSWSLPDNTTGNTDMYQVRSGDLLMSLTSFESVFEHKIMVLAFCYIPLLFLIVTTVRLVFVLKSQETLQTHRNILIAAYLISDGFILLNRTVFITFILTSEEVILRQHYVVLELFLTCFFFQSNLIFLTLLSLEKLLFINYVYIHNRVFCSVKRTIAYVFIAGVFSLLIFLRLFMINPAVSVLSPGFLHLSQNNANYSDTLPIMSALVSVICIVVCIGSSFKILHFALNQPIRNVATYRGIQTGCNRSVLHKQKFSDLISKSKYIIFPVMCIPFEYVFQMPAIIMNFSDTTQRIILTTLMIVRIFHPCFLFGNNRSLRNALLSRRNPAPFWLKDIQQEIILRRVGHSSVVDNSEKLLNKN